MEPSIFLACLTIRRPFIPSVARRIILLAGSLRLAHAAPQHAAACVRGRPRPQDREPGRDTRARERLSDRQHLPALRQGGAAAYLFVSDQWSPQRWEVPSPLTTRAETAAVGPCLTPRTGAHAHALTPHLAPQGPAHAGRMQPSTERGCVSLSACTSLRPGFPAILRRRLTPHTRALGRRQACRGSPARRG